MNESSAAKMAKNISQELAKFFNKQEIVDAIKFCYDRERKFIVEYMEENFRIQSEKELAVLYAQAHYEAWWVEDDVYNFEMGTPEYEKVCKITDDWFKISDFLRDKIFAILKDEGVVIPETGQIEVLKPFMERNGYFDRNGWWLSKKEYNGTMI